MWSLSSKQRTTEGELGYEQLVLEEGALTEEKNHKNVLREANELDANHKCYRTKKRRIFMITQDGEAQGLWLVREILFFGSRPRSTSQLPTIELLGRLLQLRSA